MSKTIFVTDRKSQHEFIDSRNSSTPNVGFDYEGRIFEKTLSNITYNGDSTRSVILAGIEKVVYQMVESVKRIRNFRNFIVDKNNKNLR